MGCRLSSSQVRVTRLAALGRSNQEIADALGLQLQTVKNYLCRAMRRLRVRNRTELSLKVLRPDLAATDASSSIVAGDD